MGDWEWEGDKVMRGQMGRHTNLKDAFPILCIICSNKDSSIWHAGERSQNS